MRKKQRCYSVLVLGVALITPLSPLGAQQGRVPAVAAMSPPATSELRDALARFTEDRAALLRRYEIEYSPARRNALRAYFTQWQARLAQTNFDRLSQEGRVDYVRLESQLRYQLELLQRDEKLLAEMTPLLPFVTTVMDLVEQRRSMETMVASRVAESLNAVPAGIAQARQALEVPRTDNGNVAAPPSRIVAYRAAATADDLRAVLDRWYRFYAAYDPLFTWWVADPYKKADAAIRDWSRYLRTRVVGIRDGEEEPIVGDPIGEDGMRADLAVELMPYSPAELIAIANREFAWCEAELKKAAREMGFGDNWKAALEKVKTLHVAPGEQINLARDLEREAVEFLEKRDLVTIPELAKEVWRMEMLSPERQLVAPFFLGGEQLLVAYPTDGMAHDDKMMAMRGNNRHFSRAVVHHEMIPGHHLQGFMAARYNPHRRAFSTPFYSEGWALYWEMLLYDLNFPQSPEDRIGMMFWRSHRAARIIFSLSFHLGTMTPQQAIDFLVDRVGHERANAEAEVRRSFNGSYSPLYQVAYMIGGLQLRALHQELVGSGKMTNKQFHDAVLQGGPLPIELVRARLTNAPLTRNYRAQWRFAGPVQAAQ